MDKAKINALIAKVQGFATERREAAGYDGSWNDNGAGRMERDIEFYRAGMEGRIPQDWLVYEITLDPEYVEYQRLKKKFGG